VTRLCVIDGHNDALLRVRRHGGSLVERSEAGHLDVQRAREAGLAAGFFAVFVPSDDRIDWAAIGGPPYELPLAPPVDTDHAALEAAAMADLLVAAEGPLHLVRTAEELERCIAGGPPGAILHLEGAEPIEPDLSNLEGWYERGLRSIGFVWSRPNAFASGAPGRFPGSADVGPGLTRPGRALVDACERLGIVVDVSHLNTRGLRGVLRRARGPVVATHSNAHAVCPSSRNLTDTELRAIAATGGVVGINFSVALLRPDGRFDTRAPIADVVRHVDHVAEQAGIDHVALGSDFDGAVIPDAIGDVTGLPRVLEALRAAGYDDGALRKIAHGNWLRVLREVWRA
jgi:membrane dipeptidase